MQLEGVFVKYINKIRDNLSKQDFPVFTIYDLKSMLAARKANKEYAYMMLHNLAKRNEIIRITRGVYSFHKDVRIVGFAFQPFYYGLEDALTIRKLWEQGSNPVIVTPRRVRNGVRAFSGRNYVLHRISGKHFFGYELLRYGNIWIPVSDTEKTLIDFIYFKHYLRDDVAMKMIKQVDAKKMRSYLKRYDKRTADKVTHLVK
jgi:predicted transcriptional regulator of viral defense system